MFILTRCRHSPGDYMVIVINVNNNSRDDFISRFFIAGFWR